MSTCVRKEIRCPSCGAAKDTGLWPGIHAQEHPELREKVLNESLFFWRCPECGYEMQLVYPCLYHDPNRGFLIFLEPNVMEPSFPKKEIEAPHGTKKRIVTSLEAMKEKVLIFEAGLNDAAVELAKLAMEKVVSAKKGVAPKIGYFCQANESQDIIEFAFYLGEETEPLYQKTKFEVYRTTLSVVTKLRFEEYSKEYLKVNPETAKLMLEAFQSHTARIR